MITDMHVFARGDRLLLDVPLSLAATLRDKLDALIFAEDARVTDESARLFVWTVIRKDDLPRGDRRDAFPTNSPR